MPDKNRVDGVFIVPEDYPTIDVDGTTIAREVFKWLSDAANCGQKFKLLRNEGGVIELIGVYD